MLFTLPLTFVLFILLLSAAQTLKPNSVANNITSVWFSSFKWSIASTRKFDISWPMCKPQCSCWLAISLLQVHLQVSSHRCHQSLPPVPPPLRWNVPAGDRLAVPHQCWSGQREERDCAQLQPRAMHGKKSPHNKCFRNRKPVKPEWKVMDCFRILKQMCWQCSN